SIEDLLPWPEEAGIRAIRARPGKGYGRRCPAATAPQSRRESRRLGERLARPLDAAAGFLDQVGARRIGDAKSRRQAEGLALNHRDADRFEKIGHEIGIAADRAAVRRLLADGAGAGRIDIEGAA